ncbi:MAG: thiamine phosphate synthase [Campylobacterales bacterium]
MKGLYLITDGFPVMSDLEEALKGGVRIVQLRYKGNWDETTLNQGRQMTQLCHEAGAKLIINDRWDLVERIGADGAHVGREDGSLEVVRKGLEGKIMGVSCYGSLELATKAVEAGADYIAFGACFASSTKPHAPTIGLEVITQARRLGRPICAIGGITLECASRVIEAGADMIAVISDFWNHPPYRVRAEVFSSLFSHS